MIPDGCVIFGGSSCKNLPIRVYKRDLGVTTRLMCVDGKPGARDGDFLAIKRRLRICNGDLPPGMIFVGIEECCVAWQLSETETKRRQINPTRRAIDSKFRV
jgi:hypothetical protein